MLDWNEWVPSAGALATPSTAIMPQEFAHSNPLLSKCGVSQHSRAKARKTETGPGWWSTGVLRGELSGIERKLPVSRAGSLNSAEMILLANVLFLRGAEGGGKSEGLESCRFIPDFWGIRWWPQTEAGCQNHPLLWKGLTLWAHSTSYGTLAWR